MFKKTIVESQIFIQHQRGNYGVFLVWGHWSEVTAFSSYHILAENAEIRNCDYITRANWKVFTILWIGFQNGFFKANWNKFTYQKYNWCKNGLLCRGKWVKSDDPGDRSSRDTGEWHDRRPAEISDLGVDNNQAQVTYGERVVMVTTLTTTAKNVERNETRRKMCRSRFKSRL